MESNGGVVLDHRGWFVIDVQVEGRGDAQRSAVSEAWLVLGGDEMGEMGSQRCVPACLRLPPMCFWQFCGEDTTALPEVVPNA